MSQENVEIVRELHEHWARGDYTFADLLDPQIEFSRSGTQVRGVDLEGQWRGLDAMWAATLEWLRAFDDLRTEAERIVDLGDNRVLALARQTARGKESGAPIDHSSLLDIRQLPLGACGALLVATAHLDRRAKARTVGPGR